MSTWAERISAVAACASVLAAIAACVIGWLSYRLAKRVQDQAEQQQRDFSDLLEALVISNLLSGPSSTGNFGNVIQAFKQKYRGTREIFK